MFTLPKRNANKSVIDYLKEKEYKDTGINEEYYANGVWYGSGATALNLYKQDILLGELENHAKALHPKTLEKIGKSPKISADNCYLEAALSSVKDFSMFYFLDENLTEEDYKKDLLESLQETIEYIESLCEYRINSSNKIGKLKPIIAAIQHETSRPTKKDKETIRPDMQIHFHLLFSRLGIIENNEDCRTLYNRKIYKFQKAIGTKFRASQANKLRKRGFSIDKAVDYQETENNKKIRINAFSVNGITIEERKLFSKRDNEIEYLAKKYNMTNYSGKQLIAQKSKSTKVKYNKEELKQIWKEDANEIGLTNNKIQSLKTFDKKYVLKYAQTDESLLYYVAKCSTNKKTGNLNITEVIAKLFENEQYTGECGLTKYNNWIKDKKITIIDDYNLKCNIDFTKKDIKEKKLKNKITVNSSKVYDVLNSKTFSLNDLIENKISKEDIDSLNIKKTSSVVEKKKNKLFDYGSVTEDNSIAYTIEQIGVKISLLQSKLFDNKLTQIQRILIRLQIESLLQQIENLKKVKINIKNSLTRLN